MFEQTFRNIDNVLWKGARCATELDPDKQPQLIELKYHSVGDAVRELGPVGNIRGVFVGFQRNLY